MSLTKIFLKKNWYFIFLVIVYLIIRFKIDHPKTLEHSSDFYFIWLLFLIIMVRYLATEGRIRTPKFVADGVFGTISDPPVTVGEWTLFRLGGLDATPYPKLHGHEKSVCVYKKSWMRVGECYVSLARCKPIKKSMIPHPMMSYIERNNWPTDQMYKGFCTKSFEVKNPDIIELQEMINELEDQIENYKDIMEGKFSGLEAGIGSLSRLGGKLKGKKKRRWLGRSENDHQGSYEEEEQ